MDKSILIENPCSREKISDVFLPIINDALEVYQRLFGEDVLNVRLMGSVARGEAGRDSDIDFIAVLRTTPSAEQIEEVERQEQLLCGQLCRQRPLIEKVDLEVVSVTELNDFRRLVFATDSISLYGPDPYTARSITIDRWKLANMVTPDLDDLITRYKRAVERADEGDEAHLLFYSRLIGKDILKSLRRFALLRGGTYERRIDRIYQQLLHFFPSEHVLLDDLYALYIDPSPDKHQLLKVLCGAAHAKAELINRDLTNEDLTYPGV